MAQHSEAGKGSKPRKHRNDDAYRDSYDLLFQKKKQKPIHHDKRQVLDGLTGDNYRVKK